MAILDWIAANLGTYIHALRWTVPILEMVHFLGLCMLLGGLLVIDLRMLGVNRIVPGVAARDLLQLVIAGFVINLVSGVLFYVGNPLRYTPNIAFQLKMVLVILAALNAFYFQKNLASEMDSWTENTEIPMNAKVARATSLIL